MEKVIWVIGNDRKEMIEAQRGINATGSMRALCMLSFEALKKAIEEAVSRRFPSLIVIDYQMETQEEILAYLRQQEALAGVPLFFMTNQRTPEVDEDCFSRGAIVVLDKPFSNSGILRIERTAWQHDVTRNYEKMLQQQAGDLQAAREIMSLNQKLKSRNELLYQVFGRYFSDKVVDVILEHPEDTSIGGERRELTVMITDLRGFTSLSEELESEEVTGLLNFYFAKMLEIITKYRGTVIEFLGDSVLAVFGAPLASDTHPRDALIAAINMQNAMQEVNAFCAERGYPMLEMGIGVHSGEAFIGNVGSEKMMRYNVIGRVVNECSRIEGCSVGGQVLVSEKLLSMIEEPVTVKSRMEIMAKGVRKPMEVCEVAAVGDICNCLVEQEADSALKPVEKTIHFELFLVEEKLIAEKPIIAVLEQISSKRAVVSICGETGYQAILKAYSDVEIYGKDEDEQELFYGVYAKVMKAKDGKLTLHFTHVNEEFRKWLSES